MPSDAVLAWAEGICSVSRFRNDRDRSKYIYRYDGLVEALIDFAIQQVDLWPLVPDCSQATLEHLWADVILPGILDHQGDLVLHAGAVVIDGSAAIFLGDSGSGKSTLTASFLAEGQTVLSDDGIIVSDTERGVRAEAVYPGVRLLPDALTALFPASIPTAEVAHYAAKRRIIPNSRMSASKYPATLLIFLSEPKDSGPISLAAMTAAEACIGLVSKSFALDPSDKDRARARIEQASRVANTLPAYALSYPRNMSSLPKVREAIIDALSGVRLRPHPGLIT